jgi:CheY-like chemotaxis protein
MTSTSNHLHNRRVLLVDDWAEITSLVGELFGELGAIVSTANNGWDALVAINHQTYDLILLDLVIPEPDGWQILDFLSRCRPFLLERVVILTAYRYDRQTVEVLDGRRLPHLFKPFELEELCEVATRMLSPDPQAAA